MSTSPVDDNKLVTRKDLEAEKEAAEAQAQPSLWVDQDRLSKLQQEMQSLSKVRIPTESFPEDVLIKAMAESLSDLGWDGYQSFRTLIDKILKSPPKTVPFAVKTRDKITNKWDFWLIRVFINVGPNNSHYEHEELGKDGKTEVKKYSKLDVLMSRQFCDYLRDFCRTQLKDEVQFWTFTGSYRNKQHLDFSKLNRDDINALKRIGITNPTNVVMIQYKKKVPEIMVGAGASSPGVEIVGAAVVAGAE